MNSYKARLTLTRELQATEEAILNTLDILERHKQWKRELLNGLRHIEADIHRQQEETASELVNN